MLDPADLATYLNDPDTARIFVAAEDQPRLDDEFDHGDPMMERWGQGLAVFGDAVCAQATLACARLLLLVWETELPGDPVVPQAVQAAQRGDLRACRQALAALNAREGHVGWAHLHDTLRAARCAVLAREGGRAVHQVALATLYAFRVVAWSSYAESRSYARGEAALWEAIVANPRLQGALALSDRADRARQIVRILVSESLTGGHLPLPPGGQTPP